jgi:hypothetical protein
MPVPSLSPPPRQVRKAKPVKPSFIFPTKTSLVPRSELWNALVAGKSGDLVVPTMRSPPPGAGGPFVSPRRTWPLRRRWRPHSRGVQLHDEGVRVGRRHRANHPVPQRSRHRQQRWIVILSAIFLHLQKTPITDLPSTTATYTPNQAELSLYPAARARRAVADTNRQLCRSSIRTGRAARMSTWRTTGCNSVKGKGRLYPLCSSHSPWSQDFDLRLSEREKVSVIQGEELARTGFAGTSKDMGVVAAAT